MKRTVYNNNIGSPYSFNYPTLTNTQEREVLAGLFEQLLIFDQVVISTNRLNYGLYFLIKTLGIKTVEKLFDYGYIKIMLWTPVIMTGSGRNLEDGSIDENVIYGQVPIAAGRLTDDDTDPENNIYNALQYFGMHRDKRRIFTRTAAKNYIVPNGKIFSEESADFVIDAYLKNNLSDLGLPFEREPEQLHLAERMRLLELSHKVLETAILSKYGLKSFENFEHYSICKKNLSNIGKAYNIAEGTNTLFNLRGLPNLKELYLQRRLNFDSIFQLRHLSTAKYYRKWINEVGENMDAQEITEEYINEIEGNNKFFSTTNGKLLRNMAVFGAGTAIGAAVTGPIGIAAGFALGILDTFWLDSILKGKNPNMFIDNIKNTLGE